MGCGLDGLEEGGQSDGEWKNATLAAELELGERPVDAGLEGVDAGRLDVQCLALERRLVCGWDEHGEWSYVEQQAVE